MAVWQYTLWKLHALHFYSWQKCDVAVWLLGCWTCRCTYVLQHIVRRSFLSSHGCLQSSHFKMLWIFTHVLHRRWVMTVQRPVCFYSADVCHNLLHLRAFTNFPLTPSPSDDHKEWEVRYRRYIAERNNGTQSSWLNKQIIMPSIHSTEFIVYTTNIHVTHNDWVSTLKLHSSYCTSKWWYAGYLQSQETYWAEQMMMVSTTTTVMATPTEISANRRICCGDESVVVDRSCMAVGKADSQGRVQMGNSKYVSSVQCSCVNVSFTWTLLRNGEWSSSEQCQQTVKHWNISVVAPSRAQTHTHSSTW